MTDRLKHDALFKQIMSNEIAAREFLDYYLPTDFKQQLDLRKIKLEKESYVEENLRHQLSDIVFSIQTKTNDKAFVYIIIEHQSTCDYWIALRLMKYMMLLSERDKKARSKLPLVCPLVFYTGKAKYTAPRNFWQLFTDPEQAKKLIGGDYQLVNLQAMSDDEIQKKEHLGMMEYFMKHIHDRDMLKLWDDFFTTFKRYITIDKDRGYIYINPFLCYTSTKVAEDQHEALQQIISNHLSDEDDIMRSIAQKYIDEGKTEGIQIGVAKGKTEGIQIGVAKGKTEGIQIGVAKGKTEGAHEAKIAIAKNLLKSGLPVNLIAKSTGLSAKELDNLRD